MNPFGVIYNPRTICKSLQILIGKKVFTEKDLFYHNETWNSFSHHSRFSNPDKDACLDLINREIEASSLILQNASFLCITFGTSMIFEWKKTGEVVSNCHKLPSAEFIHRSLTIEEIVADTKDIIKQITAINPTIRFIFTLSPVRHLKDGAAGNSLSKSILRVAIDNICKDTGAFYFPSFEIMMDDLRDYRFYADDLCHPSSQAVDYIWEKFAGTFFSTETNAVIQAVNKIGLAIRHRPFNPDSENYSGFLKRNIAELNELSARCPFLELASEKAEFEKRLKMISQ